MNEHERDREADRSDPAAQAQPHRRRRNPYAA